MGYHPPERGFNAPASTGLKTLGINSVISVNKGQKTVQSTAARRPWLP